MLDYVLKFPYLSVCLSWHYCSTMRQSEYWWTLRCPGVRQNMSMSKVRLCGLHWRKDSISSYEYWRTQATCQSQLTMEETNIASKSAKTYVLELPSWTSTRMACSRKKTSWSASIIWSMKKASSLWAIHSRLTKKLQQLTGQSFKGWGHLWALLKTTIRDMYKRYVK